MGRQGMAISRLIRVQARALRRQEHIMHHEHGISAESP
jgi:hypothetical protein